jgi:hypothetical protein
MSQEGKAVLVDEASLELAAPLRAEGNDCSKTLRYTSDDQDA